MHPEDVRMLRLSEREPLIGGPKHRSRRVTLLVGTLALLSGGTYITVKSQAANSLRFGKELSSRGRDKDEVWASFKDTYGKAYASEEHEGMSRANFEARLEDLAELNRRNGAAVFGVTRHADRPLRAEAFKRGRRERDEERDAARTHSGRVELPAPRAGNLPAMVDWRDDRRGVVTPVKNQGQCGSCWAFSATEQIESQMVLAGAPAVELSPQQLASCAVDPVVEMCCDGCGGGDPSAAYEYLIAAGLDGAGLAPEAFWPYSQSLTPDGECEAPQCTEACDRDVVALESSYEFIGPYARITSYGLATPECESGACAAQNLTQLAARLVDAPLSVCLNAQNFDDYVGGVLTVDACGGFSADDIDHCVQLVGYNKEADVPYWIVRNSWSADWGEDGFIRLQFDANTCGIANEATLVQLAGQWSDPAAAAASPASPSK